MSKYRCQECQTEVDGMLFKCPECGKVATMKEVTGPAHELVSEDASSARETPGAVPKIEVPSPSGAEVTSSDRKTPERPVESSGDVRDGVHSESVTGTQTPAIESPRAAPDPCVRAPDTVVEKTGSVTRSPSTTPSPQVLPGGTFKSDSERLAWRYPRECDLQEEGRRPLRSCPAVSSEGNLFVCMQHQLLMFSPNSSSPTWNYPTGGTIIRSPAIGPDGDIHVHSEDGFLHVVNLDGQPVFEPVAVGQPLGWASPLVDHKGNTWICRCDGGLKKVDAAGQSEHRPFFRTRRRFDCSGLIFDEILYIGCEDHYLYAIRLGGDRGENLWAHSTECGRTRSNIQSALALANRSEIVVASQDDQLYAFGWDGKQRWSVSLPGHALSSPVADGDGTVYLGVTQNLRNRDARGVLVSVGHRTHKVGWQYEADGPVESTPVIGDDGILYFGDNAGCIHAVDAEGKGVWKTSVGAPVRSAGAIVSEGRVAFGLDNGCLVVLKCSSRGLCTGGWPTLLGPSGPGGKISDA